MKTEREKKLKEYIKLLGEELDELAVLAHTHGWRSTRGEQGLRLRNEIDELEKEDDTNAIEAELRSLKQTIIESGLLSYAPEREMSFHNKVVFAIDKLIQPSDSKQSGKSDEEILNKLIENHPSLFEIDNCYRKLALQAMQESRQQNIPTENEIKNKIKELCVCENATTNYLIDITCTRFANWILERLKGEIK